MFWKGEKLEKKPSGIRTHALQIRSFTYCTALLGKHICKENISKLMLHFIVYFNRKYGTLLRCPIPPLGGSLYLEIFFSSAENYLMIDSVLDKKYISQILNRQKNAIFDEKLYFQKFDNYILL